MKENPIKALDDLARSVGRYPAEAFVFLREGLTFAARKIHGPESDVYRAIQEYLAEHQLTWNDVVAQYFAGTLPKPLGQWIDEAGGCQQLNRHISGRELCWGLRDYAQRRWGLLASTVLDSWNIRKTEDFGRIVFGFIAADLMQKQPDDSLDDFRDVFSFAEAFDASFKTAACTESENEDFRG